MSHFVCSLKHCVAMGVSCLGFVFFRCSVAPNQAHNCLCVWWCSNSVVTNSSRKFGSCSSLCCLTMTGMRTLKANCPKGGLFSTGCWISTASGWVCTLHAAFVVVHYNCPIKKFLICMLVWMCAILACSTVSLAPRKTGVRLHLISGSWRRTKSTTSMSRSLMMWVKLWISNSALMRFVSDKNPC